MAIEVYLGDAPSYVKQWVENYYEKLKEPLCFTAVDAGATIQLAKTGEPDPIEIVYSTDKDIWEDYDFTTVVILENEGDKVYFRAKTENDVSFYKDYSNYYKFVAIDGKKVAASGNMQTLMKADGAKLDISGKTHCYSYMFSNCISLTQAPALPAITLAEYCYEGMFYNCIYLTQAPELPAKTLTDNCYSYMFQDCISLSSMDVSFTAWNPSSATENWLFNAGTNASNPLFICPSALDILERDDSHVPNGWSIQPK